jgi:hypothetical protein
MPLEGAGATPLDAPPSEGRPHRRTAGLRRDDPTPRPDATLAREAASRYSIAPPCRVPFGTQGRPLRARSSAEEHYLDMVGVTGSIPVAPTIAIDGMNRRPLGWADLAVGWATPAAPASGTPPRRAGFRGSVPRPVFVRRSFSCPRSTGRRTEQRPQQSAASAHSSQFSIETNLRSRVDFLRSRISSTGLCA